MTIPALKFCRLRKSMVAFLAVQLGSTRRRVVGRLGLMYTNLAAIR